jgi:hypothetical protein
MESRKKKDEEIVFCVWCIDSFDCSKNIKKDKKASLYDRFVVLVWLLCVVVVVNQFLYESTCSGNGITILKRKPKDKKDKRKENSFKKSPPPTYNMYNI